MPHYQKFETKEVERSEIKEHPDNPRKISDSAKKKLNAGLNKYGLLEALMINKSTMHLLSGHQRLAWLDKKHKDRKDYKITVNIVNIPEKEELTLIALMNQENAMGEWDADILGKVIKSGKLNYKTAGFDDESLALIVPEFDFTPTEKRARKEIDIIELKKMRRKGNQNVQDKNDSENYIVVNFPTRNDKNDFLKSININADIRYLSYTTTGLIANLKKGKPAKKNKSGRNG